MQERYPKSEEYVRKNLIPYRLCNRCNNHILKSVLEDEGYKYQCMYCDEDLYEFETHEMKEKKEISDFDFEDLVEQTQSMLCLDDE